MTAFDTSPLIWGVRQLADPPAREFMIARTVRFLEHLSSQDAKIAVPAPDVAEYLAGFSEDEQDAQRRKLEHRFRILSFDAKAAVIAARLWSRKECVKEARAAGRIDRHPIKTDCEILACAIAGGAYRIVTGEPEAFRVLARGFPIMVDEVPDVPQQKSLAFDRGDAG